MQLFYRTILFILSKWDTSLDEFKPIGKFLWYIPSLLNNILTQIFYFILFPIVYFYIFVNDQVNFLKLILYLI